jgi:hypothetical protein
MQKLSKRIQDWFFLNRSSLILPDGWYGRPYDNLHELTKIDESDTQLTITLDGKLELCFSELKSLTERDGALVFADFKKLTCQFRSYDDPSKLRTCEYESGEVKLVPSSAAPISK